MTLSSLWSRQTNSTDKKVLVNPDPDQVARDVVTFGETVECLASEEFLGNLPLEVDAVGTVPGHGFHPLKARLSWSIPNPQDVHLLGRTPLSVLNSPGGEEI